MIQKVSQIKEEKKFENIITYGLMDLNQGIAYYEQGIETLKKLLLEYPNCLEKEVVERILNHAKEMGRKVNKGPNSYSHYQEEYPVECGKEKKYIKIGSFHINPQGVIDLRNVPIRLYNYGINGSYVNRTIVDLNYDREEEEIECIGISHTAPWSTLKTFVMTSEQIKFSEIHPVKLKSIRKET